MKKQKHDFIFFFRSMYNKTIIRFGFCDIQNNRDLSKGYQPVPSASADNGGPTSTSIILDITKTSSNNCLKFDNLFIFVWCVLSRLLLN